VGASHMDRLAGVMGPRAVSLAFPGFRPREPMLSKLIEQLKKLKLNKLDTVVLDLLSNTAFMGTDDSGLPSEPLRSEGGKYHITGSLTIAPPTITKKVLLDCLPLAAALKGTGTVLLSPVPRYVYEKCCAEPSHLANFDDPDLDKEIVSGLEGIKRQLQNWGAESDLLFNIIDPTLLTNSCDLSLKTRVASDGRPPWERGDPVHLSVAACRDLAAVIGDSVLAGAAGDSASDAGSGSGSQSHKRRRIEPVVTMPPPDARKRLGGYARARVAGWLVGRPDAGPGNGPRRGFGHPSAVGGSRGRGGGLLRGHGGHYSGSAPRGGWRYGGRSRR
jgi:hypothetical protein